MKRFYIKWKKIPDKLRFIIIGCINAAFSYLVFALIIFLIGQENYQIAVALQWSLCSIVSFVNQKIFVFCTKGNWLKEYIKCCTTWVISYICNAIILEIIVRFITKNVYVGQFVSIGLSAIITYCLFKHFAFRRKSKK